MNTARALRTAHEVIKLATTYGWRFTPLNGKVPIEKGWPELATNDPVAIQALARKYPKANFGLVTGMKSGVDVLDVDPAHGGDGSLQAFEAQYGPLPHTVEVRTGRDGRHIYFKHQTDLRVSNSVGQLGRGLDFRTTGGQVVVPPSLHPETGRPYEWDIEHHPNDIPLALIPSWLVHLLTRPVPNNKFQCSAVIPQGVRQDTLFKQIRSLRCEGKYSNDDIAARIHIINKERCRPPLGDREVDETIQHGLTYDDRPDFRQHADGMVAANDTVLDDEGDTPPKKKSQATRLIELASGRAEFFHRPDREPFSAIQCGTHQEVWSIKSKGFRQWLAGLYFHETAGAVGGQAMQDAISVFASMALFKGPERVVFLRVGEFHGDLYLDLANEKWQAVRITKSGWMVVDRPPIAFRRPKSMQALPLPSPGGSVDVLHRLVNITDEGQWTLFVSWLIAAIRPIGPYPILTLNGEQGTGKSTIARIIKAVLDPAVAGNRGAPRTVRDLMIAASNAHILSFDNLSYISQELSDGLCRLSTGGGLSTRELFSDADEVVFDATRPMIINSITDCVTSPDLVDRSVIVTPSRMPTHHRREERKLLAEVDQNRPVILGALLDAVVHGLRTVDTVSLPSLPRMADFAKWASACEPAFGWTPGRFMETYECNRKEALEVGLDASPITASLHTLMESTDGVWNGTATDLLTRLIEIAEESPILKTKAWPKRPNTLSNMLKQLAPPLRETGMQVTFGTRTNSTGRSIRIERKEPECKSSSLAPPSSHAQHSKRLDGDDTRQGLITGSSGVPCRPARPRRCLSVMMRR